MALYSNYVVSTSSSDSEPEQEKSNRNIDEQRPTKAVNSLELKKNIEIFKRSFEKKVGNEKKNFGLVLTRCEAPIVKLKLLFSDVSCKDSFSRFIV
uniref:Uncharacterized protein n=1 Tax=Romanomermis culicivorax TaxID=13658 RepID=A0A915KPL5_ROMCU